MYSDRQQPNPARACSSPLIRWGKALRRPTSRVADKYVSLGWDSGWAGRTRLIPKWVGSTRLYSFQPCLPLRISRSLSKLSWFKSSLRPRLAPLLATTYNRRSRLYQHHRWSPSSLSNFFFFSFSVIKAPPFHCLCFRLAWVWVFWLVRKKVGLGVGCW